METKTKAENSTMISKLFTKKLKTETEENKPQKFYDSKTISINNEQSTKNKIQYLFPDIPQHEINSIIDRSENNIEKAILLVKNFKKEEARLQTLKNPMKAKKIIKFKRPRQLKRNYNTAINYKPSSISKNEEENETQETNKSNIENTNNVNNNKVDTNNNINDNNIQKNQTTNLNDNIINNNSTNNNYNNINVNNNTNINVNNNINNNINNNNSLDQERTNLINRQVNYLVEKFKKMHDISELKQLLTNIGFPTEKVETTVEFENKINEKIRSNQEEKQSIIEKYNKYDKTQREVENKKEKLDEMNGTLCNLVEIESLQKIRQEHYKNELTELLKSKSNQENIFGGGNLGY